MAQVNERKNEMMRSQEVDSFTVKTNKNSAEFIYPSESAFTNEATFIYFSIEQTLATTLNGFAVTVIFWDVRHKLMVETGFASLEGIESGISIEKCASNG